MRVLGYRTQAAPSAGVLAELAGIDPAGLPRPLDRVAYLQAVDRCRGFVEALAHTAIVALAGAAASQSYR